jgi:hypothetical protein
VSSFSQELLQLIEPSVVRIAFIGGLPVPGVIPQHGFRVGVVALQGGDEERISKTFRRRGERPFLGLRTNASVEPFMYLFLSFRNPRGAFPAAAVA